MSPPRFRPRPTPEWSQFVLLAATALRMALSLVLTVLVGRTLAPAEFGAVALVATMFGLAHEVTDMGTGNVAVRAAARAPQQERLAIEQLMGVRVVLSLLTALACAGYAVIETTGVLRFAVLATSAVIACSFASACSAAFQLRQAQLPPSVLSVAVQAATVLLAWGSVRLGVPGTWLPLLVVAREAAAVVGTILLARSLLGYTPRPRLGGAAMGAFTGTSAVVALATLAYHLQLQSGPFWVQMLRPSAELGAFGAALRPLAPVLFLPWVVMLPLTPLLSWLAATDRAGFRRQARAALDLSIGLGAVIGVASFVMAPAVLEMLYGPRFSQGPLSAVAALRWLSLPLGISFVTAGLTTLLLADHQERRLLWLSLSGLVVYAALNLLLLPRLGHAGSAIATALSITLILAGGLAIAARRGIRPGKRSAAMLAPSAALAGVLTLLPGPPILALALAAPASLAALALVWRFPGLAAERREQAELTRSALAQHG